jgi:type I restriction enzyme S subunit
MNNLTLKDCCSFQEGYVNPSQTNRDYFNGPIKWLRASDLNDSIVFHTEKSLSKKGFDSAGRSAFLFKPNTIAISKSGTIGRLGILKAEMCGNRAVINIDVNDSIADLHYIFYLLKYKRKEIIRKAEGSIQKNLYVSALETISLNHNDKKVQQKISNALLKLDAKIQANNQINVELESMAKTLYDYWFVQFDFPNENGKPYKSSGGKMFWNEELKREIPYGWEVCKVEKLLLKESSQIKTPSSEYELCGKIPIIDQSTDFIAGYTNNQNAVINGNVIPRIVFGDHTRILKLINFDFVRGADGTQVLLSNNKRIPQHVLYHSLLRIELSNYGYARHFKFLKDSLVILPDINVANVYEERCSSFYNLIKENIFQNIKIRW